DSHCARSQSQFRFEIAVMTFDFESLDGAFDGNEEFVFREWFDNVIESALTHRFHSSSDGRKRRHDDHRDIRVDPSQFLKKFQTVHAGHSQVADDQGERLLLRQIHCFSWMVLNRYIEPMIREDRANHRSLNELVIDNHYAMHTSILQHFRTRDWAAMRW